MTSAVGGPGILSAALALGIALIVQGRVRNLVLARFVALGFLVRGAMDVAPSMRRTA